MTQWQCFVLKLRISPLPKLNLAALGLLAALAFAGGCAQQPPNRNSLSGKRLRVTMTFRSPVSPDLYYFFTINNAGSQDAPGPVPVLGPLTGGTTLGSYGNGFAASSNSSNQNFMTDFVLFGRGVSTSSGYALYHVTGDPNQRQFSNPINPVATTPPGNVTTTNTYAASTLQFDIDMSQIAINPLTGGTYTDTSQAVSAAQQIRYLQVNIIATDNTPTEATTTVVREVDAMGDTGTASHGSYGSGVNSFLLVDMSQVGRTYSSTDTTAANIQEPDYPDQFITGGDPVQPSLDLVSWTVQVVNQ